MARAGEAGQLNSGRRIPRRLPVVATRLAVVSVLSAAAASAAFGAVGNDAPGKQVLTLSSGVNIETALTKMNFNSGDFTMPSHVKFTRPGTDAVGDSAHGNTKTGVVILTGRVVVHDSGDAPEAQRAGAAPGGGPSTLTCDELHIDTKRKLYLASGHVHYTQGTRYATADTGQLDQGAHELDLSGSVRMGDGDQTLTADAVHYNTVTKDVSTSGRPLHLSLPASSALPGTTSTLPLPAAKATPKPK